MPNVDEIYSGSTLKAEDLGDQEWPMTIHAVEVKDYDDGRKLVIYFQGEDRGFVLNKTNSTVIKEQYGSETDDWIGKTITIFASQTDFQGKVVPCIRVKKPMRQSARPVRSGPASGPRPANAPSSGPARPAGRPVNPDADDVPY